MRFRRIHSKIFISHFTRTNEEKKINKNYAFESLINIDDVTCSYMMIAGRGEKKKIEKEKKNQERKSKRKKKKLSEARASTGASSAMTAPH